MKSTSIKMSTSEKMSLKVARNTEETKYEELQRSMDETIFDSNPHPVSKRINKEKGKTFQYFVKDRAFQNYLKSYTIECDVERNVDIAFDIYKTQVGKILGKEFKNLKGLEVKIGVKVSYSKAQNHNITEFDIWHQSQIHRILDQTTIKETLHTLMHEVKTKVLNNEVTGGAVEDMVGAAPHRISDAIFRNLDQLDVHVLGYQPLVGGTYIKTPEKLVKSKAIRNIKNTDEKCFLWSILAKFHPADHNHYTRVSNYKPFESELDMNAIDYPVKIDTNTYKNFERQNEKIILNVFDCDGKEIHPLYISSKLKTVETTEVDLVIMHDK